MRSLELMNLTKLSLKQLSEKSNSDTTVLISNFYF